MQDRILGGLKVLIIDDDSFYRGLLRRIVQQFGNMTVEDIGAPDMAMPVIEHFKPDIVLCDIEMKPIDGIEVLRRIRENPATINLPVVMVTSHAQSDLVMAARRHRASGYLVKPVSLADIKSRMIAALAAHNVIRRSGP